MTVSPTPPDNNGQPSKRRTKISKKEISAIITELGRQKQGGRQLTQTDRLVSMRKLTEAGGVHTLEPLLPLCLNLNGKPYHLHEHFPFSPVFKTTMPRRMLLKTGRQVSKSTSLASHGVVLSNCIPDFKTLYICPLYEQIRRFSNNYVRPFIDRSPVKTMWSGTTTENSVLQRTFKNHSMMIFSFALLDADRIRGVSADKVAIDEVQDMDPDHLPIIGETMSHSDWGIHQYTGTPKSLDNPIRWYASCLPNVSTALITSGMMDKSVEYDFAKKLIALCRISRLASRIACLILFSEKRTVAAPSVFCC